jgi:hypothetical protein
MASTPPEDCRCEHLCPDGRCIAIYVQDKHQCWLLCQTSGTTDIPDAQLPLDARLNIEAHGVELVELATLLDEHCDVELLMPAAAARRRVSLYLKDTTLGAVIDHLGLVSRQTP